MKWIFILKSFLTCLLLWKLLPFTITASSDEGSHELSGLYWVLFLLKDEVCVENAGIRHQVWIVVAFALRDGVRVQLSGPGDPSEVRVQVSRVQTFQLPSHSLSDLTLRRKAFQRLLRLVENVIVREFLNLFIHTRLSILNFQFHLLVQRLARLFRFFTADRIGVS